MSYSKVANTPSIISQRTYVLKEKLWWENFAANLPYSSSERDIMMLPKRVEPALVLGAGPSVSATTIDELEQSRKRFRLFSSDRMLIPLLNKGLIPNIVSSVDGDPVIANFYNDPIVRAHNMNFDVVLAANVSPEVVMHTSLGHRYWFNVAFDNPEDMTQRFKCQKCGAENKEFREMSITRASHWMNKRTMMQPYGNVGSFLFGLAVELEATPIILVGIDFSYGENMVPMRTPYWDGLLALHSGDVKKTVKDCYRYETNPFGKRVLTDVVMDGYRHSLMEGVRTVKAEVWNTSRYSVVHGDGVKCMSLQDALAKL